MCRNPRQGPPLFGQLAFAAALITLSLTGCSPSGSVYSPPPPPPPTMRTLTAIVVTPVNATVALGASQQFTAMGTFSDGSTSDISATVTWDSSDPTISSISASGLATVAAIGRVLVTASSGALDGSTRLIVVEGAAASVPRFSYATNPTDNTISAYTVDAASGRLRAHGYTQLDAAWALAVDPAGKYAYAIDANGGLTAFAIDQAAGGLTAIAGAVYATGSSPDAVAVDPSGSFVYVASGLAATVSGYAIDRGSGKLTLITGSPFTVTGAGAATEALAVHPSGNFLYVTDSGANKVSAYAIDPARGALRAIAGSPFVTGTGPTAIAIDPAGKVAIVVNKNSGTASSYTINAASGVLTQAADSPRATGAGPASVSVTPDGQYAYVANSAASNVSGFSIDRATGALAAVPGGSFAAGASPLSVMAEPSGKFVYVLNAGTSSETITAYAIDAPTGNLVTVDSIRTRGQGGMLAMSSGTAPVTYTTKFAYVANNYGNKISGYSVDPAAGVLTTITGSPFATGASPCLATNPTGTFLYSINGSDGNISGFAIDQASGGLSAAPGSPFAGGTLNSPCSMAVDPTGAYAYVPNNNPISTTVAGFEISPSTGALTTLAGSPFTAGTAPDIARMDPIGKYLYVTNAISNDVSGFAVDAATGALAPVPGSSFSTGTDPIGLAIDPTGQYVYVANGVSNTVTGFRIDPASGAMTGIVGATISLATPVAVAVDGTGSFLYVASRYYAPNYVNDIVSAYRIDPATGALTPVPGSPFTAAVGANDMEVDFSGRFLYLANSEGGAVGDVSVFSIDAASGLLTQVVGSPFVAGYVPGSVVTTGQIQ